MRQYLHAIREDRETQSSVEGGLLLAPRTAIVRACHVVHRNVTKGYQKHMGLRVVSA